MSANAGAGPEGGGAGPDGAVHPGSRGAPAGTIRAGVRWLGHSTVLLELPGLTALTDPLFRDRLGPLRRHGPTPDPASLPRIDVVLISHAHPDHFDRASLRAIPGDPLLLVPSGMAPAVHRALPGVRALGVHVAGGTTVGPWSIEAVRARHWRWPLTPTARAVGYLIDGPLGVYFAGDTAEFGEMRELAGRVDVALLPIGRWGPHASPGHLTPEAAARVAATIGARAVVPIHWGTLYPRGLEHVAAEPLVAPAGRFRAALARHAPAVVAPELRPGDGVTLELPARGGSAKA